MTKHDERLEQLMDEPWRIGLEGKVWATKEVEVWDQRKKRLITAIDILFNTGDRYQISPYHVIEYKSSSKQMKKAEWQLNQAGLYVRQHYSSDPYKWFVYGADFDYKIFGRSPHSDRR